MSKPTIFTSPSHSYIRYSTNEKAEASEFAEFSESSTDHKKRIVIETFEKLESSQEEKYLKNPSLRSSDLLYLKDDLIRLVKTDIDFLKSIIGSGFTYP